MGGSVNAYELADWHTSRPSAILDAWVPTLENMTHGDHTFWAVALPIIHFCKKTETPTPHLGGMGIRGFLRLSLVEE